MIAALKAEFTKLLTVRSTYFLTLFVCAVIILISFYAIGIKQPAAFLLAPTRLQSTIFGEMQFVGGIAAVVSILLMAHEYRYNTINYSFTISNSRTKVLLGKFLAASSYAVVLWAVAIGIGIGSLYAGAAVAGHTVGPQNFGIVELFGQSLFSVWGMAMAGLIVTILLRNLVGSIAFIFIFPTLESLAGLLLKNNVGYLPFTALGAVTPIVSGQGGFAAGKSVIIFVVYIIVFAVIAWLSTLRRDAN